MTKGKLEVTVYLLNKKVQVQQTRIPINRRVDSSNKVICRETQAFGNNFLLLHGANDPIASLKAFYIKLGWIISAY